MRDSFWRRLSVAAIVMAVAPATFGLAPAIGRHTPIGCSIAGSMVGASRDAEG